jgi:hypothetical protein
VGVVGWSAVPVWPLKTFQQFLINFGILKVYLNFLGYYILMHIGDLIGLIS